MVKTISAYLAGNIQKGHENESAIFWTSNDIAVLKEKTSPHQIIFLNPSSRSDDLTNQKSVFGRDMSQVFLSDVTLVDVRERRGLGVGAEMMWAKANGRYVISLCPKNSHYHKENCHLLGQNVTNWTHPFVESLSDVIVETVDEMGEALLHFILSEPSVKNLDFVDQCMAYYQENQLTHDLPMKAILCENPFLHRRLQISQELKK